MKCVIITILIMTIGASQYLEATLESATQCEIPENACFAGSLPNIPTICINGIVEIDVNLPNERSESLKNLNSFENKVEDENPQVETADSITSFTFEGKKLFLRLPKCDNVLDLSKNSSNESITTLLGSPDDHEYKYVQLEEEDDSSFFFEKSLSGDRTVIQSPDYDSTIEDLKGTHDVKRSLEENLTKRESVNQNSQLGDQNQSEAALCQKEDGKNSNQNSSTQMTVTETTTYLKIPNGDIPNRNLSRSSFRKSMPPRSFLLDSGFDIYNSSHNFEPSKLTAKIANVTKEDEKCPEEIPKKKSIKNKKTRIWCLGCFPKKNVNDSDDYYKKIAESSESD